MNGEELLPYVEAYASLGIATFPIHMGSRAPASRSHGHHDATLSVDEFVRLLGRFKEQHRIGLRARMGDALVDGGYAVALDVDEKHGKSGSTTLKLRGYEPPETLRQTTRHGGVHLVYRSRYPVRTKDDWIEGVDVKGTGNGIVVWPTTGYAWVDPEREIVDAPSWLVNRVRRGYKQDQAIDWDEGVVDKRTILCPVHEREGSKPSLQMKTYSDGTVRYHCFAGCSIESVALALGLDVEDIR